MLFQLLEEKIHASSEMLELRFSKTFDWSDISSSRQTFEFVEAEFQR